jgi:hypothetical protein
MAQDCSVLENRRLPYRFVQLATLSVTEGLAASSDWMIVNSELERIWKGAIQAHTQNFS